jgi:hypothetical protein
VSKLYRPRTGDLHVAAKQEALMSYKSSRLGMLALVLAVSAGAAAQTSALSPANAPAEDNASPQNNLFAPRDAYRKPTHARLPLSSISLAR